MTKLEMLQHRLKLVKDSLQVREEDVIKYKREIEEIEKQIKELTQKHYIGDRYISSYNCNEYILGKVNSKAILINVNTGNCAAPLNEDDPEVQWDNKCGKYYITELPTRFPDDFIKKD